jgi:hypothetical protein
MTLTTHPHVVPRSRTSTNYTSSLLGACMAIPRPLYFFTKSGSMRWARHVAYIGVWSWWCGLYECVAHRVLTVTVIYWFVFCVIAMCNILASELITVFVGHKHFSSLSNFCDLKSIFWNCSVLSIIRAKEEGWGARIIRTLYFIHRSIL